MDLNVADLKNRYYAFRHGESMANVEGIIVSDPSVGMRAYGLSEKGRMQVMESARKLDFLRKRAVVVSSDFLRARETAEIVRSVLEADPVLLNESLRERYFGKWEGLHYKHYATAWEGDELNAELEKNGAESANSVRRRMIGSVLALESECRNQDIVLVSHGDPLRFIQTAFSGLRTEENGQVPYFGTAEWRLLNQ